jgi:two-component system LytT family sensor kinase
MPSKSLYRTKTTMLRNYFFPVLFGLAIYTTLRLINDSIAGESFWQRPLRQNAVEILFVVLVSFASDRLLRAAIRRFAQRAPSFSLRGVTRELALVGAGCLLLFNPVLYLIHFLINDPLDMADALLGNFLVLLYVLLYYAILRGNVLLQAYVAQQKQLELARSEQLATELQFLRAQYHPHFLFNALNTIYFQMDEDVPAAKKTVEAFAALLRYQLYDQHQPVPVVKEFDHLERYISLQQVRLGEGVRPVVQLPHLPDAVRIYPLLLLPLVENAFKHLGGDRRLSVSAALNGNEFTFEVRNGSVTGPSQKPGGLGLENLRRRLQLLYPGQHRLTCEKGETEYMAILKLELT